MHTARAFLVAALIVALAGLHHGVEFPHAEHRFALWRDHAAGKLLPDMSDPACVDAILLATYNALNAAPSRALSCAVSLEVPGEVMARGLPDIVVADSFATARAHIEEKGYAVSEVKLPGLWSFGVVLPSLPPKYVRPKISFTVGWDLT